MCCPVELFYENNSKHFAFYFFGGQAFSSPLLKGARGEVEGHAVVLSLKTEIVQKMLRTEYELLPQKSTKEGTHPLLLLFFNFKKVSPAFSVANKISKRGMNYKSLYILIPYVKLKASDSKKIYSTLPVGLMSSHFMVFMSRRFSGLNKKWAHIDWTKESFVALNNIKANFKIDSRTQIFDPQLIKTFIDMPILADSPINSLKFGSSKASLDWSQATLKPESAEIVLGPNFLKEIPQKVYSVKSILDDSLGAFSFKTTFFVANFITF